MKHGRLYMVDLAGSERAAQTQDRTLCYSMANFQRTSSSRSLQNRGKRLKEGAHINRSLLALGNCINALAEGKAKYVNYRVRVIILPASTTFYLTSAYCCSHRTRS